MANTAIDIAWIMVDETESITKYLKKIMDVAQINRAEEFDLMTYDNLVKSFVIADKAAAVKDCLSPLLLGESVENNTIYVRKRELLPSPSSAQYQLFHNLTGRGNIGNLVLNIGNNNGYSK